MNRYIYIHNIHLDVQWGMSKRKILPRIEEMLQNDIPVMLSGDATEKICLLIYIDEMKRHKIYEQVVFFNPLYYGYR